MKPLERKTLTKLSRRVNVCSYGKVPTTTRKTTSIECKATVAHGNPTISYRWVFLGVAYTGLNDDEEAENSYRRAIEIDPDNMLAWQGLVSFYEKRERLDDMAKIVNDLLPRAAERYEERKDTNNERDH